jgi:hypothetical protein
MQTPTNSDSHNRRACGEEIVIRVMKTGEGKVPIVVNNRDPGHRFSF